MEGMQFSSVIENKKLSPESGYRTVWDRVAENALQIVYNDRDLKNNPTLLAKVEGILNDPAFKSMVTNIWTEQAMKSSGVTDDPEKQDDRWANGLAFRIKDMIDN